MALEALVEACPIPAAFSTTTTLRPARASSRAIAEPITPAPTTTASAVVLTPTPYGAQWLPRTLGAGQVPALEASQPQRDSFCARFVRRGAGAPILVTSIA